VKRIKKVLSLSILLNSVAGIQKEMEQIIVSTYANRLLPVGIFFYTYENIEY